MDFSENVYTYYSPSDHVHLEFSSENFSSFYRLFWKGGALVELLSAKL